MAEILKFDEVLEMIRGFPPLTRVLLATPGTLQSALSSCFAAPVEVEVVDQAAVTTGAFDRLARLYRTDTGEVVCTATTTVSTDRDDVREMVLSNQHGLGRILVILDIEATFELLEVGETDDTFWRLYRLEGDGVSYLIREVFPRGPFAPLPA